MRTNKLEAGWHPPYPSKMIKLSPFRYFRTSPEIVRLTVMMIGWTSPNGGVILVATVRPDVRRRGPKALCGRGAIEPLKAALGRDLCADHGERHYL